jgi:hypothetical protein
VKKETILHSSGSSDSYCIGQHNLCSSISQRVPTLIICGEQIFQVPDNTGHMSNLEKPDEFNMHIVEFLSGIAK